MWTGAADPRRRRRRPAWGAVAGLLCGAVFIVEASRDSQESGAKPGAKTGAKPDDGSAPFQDVKAEIQGQLSQAADKLTQSAAAQAEITRKVASHIGQYHTNVKNIASTMSQVMQAKVALSKAYHEDIKQGEESRVGALEVNIPEVLGRDFQLDDNARFSARDSQDADAQNGVEAQRAEQNEAQAAATAGMDADDQVVDTASASQTRGGDLVELPDGISIPEAPFAARRSTSGEVPLPPSEDIPAADQDSAQGGESQASGVNDLASGSVADDQLQASGSTDQGPGDGNPDLADQAAIREMANTVLEQNLGPGGADSDSTGSGSPGVNEVQQDDGNGNIVTANYQVTQGSDVDGNGGVDDLQQDDSQQLGQVSQQSDGVDAPSDSDIQPTNLQDQPEQEVINDDQPAGEETQELADVELQSGDAGSAAAAGTQSWVSTSNDKELDEDPAANTNSQNLQEVDEDVDNNAPTPTDQDSDADPNPPPAMLQLQAAPQRLGARHLTSQRKLDVKRVQVGGKRLQLGSKRLQSAVKRQRNIKRILHTRAVRQQKQKVGLKTAPRGHTALPRGAPPAKRQRLSLPSRGSALLQHAASGRGKHLASIHPRSRVAPAHIRGGFGLKGTAKARAILHFRHLGAQRRNRHGLARQMHRSGKTQATFSQKRRGSRNSGWTSVAVQPRSFKIDKRARDQKWA